MIEEQASVVAIEDGRIWVETQRKSTCNQCSANTSCGISLLGRMLGIRRNRIPVLNPHDTAVSPGDTVIIGIPEQALVKGSLAVYLLPLAALFIFAYLGETLAGQLSMRHADLVAMLFGVTGLIAGFAWVRRFSRVISVDGNYQPVLVRRLTASIPVPIRI